MNSSSLHCFAFGIATKNAQNEIIEVFYSHLEIDPDPDLLTACCNELQLDSGSNISIELNAKQISALEDRLKQGEFKSSLQAIRDLSNTEQTVVLTMLVADTPPDTVEQAYLKLHLLSYRLCKPNSLNLDGVFSVLHNLAWTNEGAIDLNDLTDRQRQARLRGATLEVKAVDKFPKMTDYVVPQGVRIAHTARVRLGAYLGPGTTIMHEGFVNFNAGTEGPAMIEGRISAGVVVGSNSDLGGGCSTMGTLSGGGSEVISVGKNCLIGANAGIGFPLADNCTVEAGLYVTAGTKVTLLDNEGRIIKTVKARELSKQANLLFRRNSLSGTVECVPLTSSISLNEELHSHN